MLQIPYSTLTAKLLGYVPWSDGQEDQVAEAVAQLEEQWT